MKGFDIDIAKEVCQRLGKECVLVEQEWDGMIPALLAKKFDTIIASMSITEERKKKVDFTVKYYKTPVMLVAKKNPGFDHSAAGLKGKRIGVQRGTTAPVFGGEAVSRSRHRAVRHSGRSISGSCRRPASTPSFPIPCRPWKVS